MIGQSPWDCLRYTGGCNHAECNPDNRNYNRTYHQSTNADTMKWPPVSVATNGPVNVNVNAPGTPTTQAELFAEDMRLAAIEQEKRERVAAKRRRQEQRRKLRVRQGKGHDPRRQVICRSPVQSRGKGRR